MIRSLLYSLVGVGFAAATVRRGSLTPGGAVAALLLGSVVVYFRGTIWLVPLVAFFLSSVVIGRTLPAPSAASDQKDKQPRDAVQVACNGVIYGLLAVGDVSPLLLLISMAVATSDTWSSEIGKYFGQPTFDITTGQRVPSGLSGGVSVAGSVAGLVGAIFISMLGLWLLEHFTLSQLIFVVTCGFGGMLMDSLLGASFQARYRGVDGKVSDRHTAGSHLVRGFPWMTNDAVNLISISVTVLLAWYAI